MKNEPAVETLIRNYLTKIQDVLSAADWSPVCKFAEDMLATWRGGRQVFICGNGGSAGNAIHLANDFLYGIAKKTGFGLRVQSLSANPAVLTCLANDVGYDSIYSEQLAVQAMPGDLLIVLSGSGNSRNIINVLNQARAMDVKTYAILGFSGGKCKELADVAMHFPVLDMQVAEDIQLIVGHMVMQYLYSQNGDH